MILSCSYTFAQSNYQKYCNARFKYCIEYPIELKGQGESANGDGQEFNSKDKTINLLVYRDVREALYENTKECKKECFKIDSKSEKGKIVSYKKDGDNYYVVSGTKGDIIFYQKTIYINSGMITAIIEYDVIKKDTYDNYCSYLFKTFK